MRKQRRNSRNTRIAETLRSLSPYSDMSDRINTMIDRWLVDSWDSEQLNDALKQLFADYMAKGQASSRECLECLQQARKRLGMQAPTLEVKMPRRPHSRRIWLRVAVAASVLIAVTGISLGIFFGGKVDNKAWIAALREAPHTLLETIDGVQKDATLADGTQVWINSESCLVMPDTFGPERHVALQGEAFFEVSHDPGRSFYVHTDHLSVCVLGTKFNVEEDRATGATRITLHEGSVEVTIGYRTKRLLPGERLTYLHNENEWRIEPAELIDWRSSSLSANNRTLPDLLRMVGNYYDHEIVFDEAAISDGELYTSTFGKDLTPEQVINSLAFLSGAFTFHSEGDRIVIETTLPE